MGTIVSLKNVTVSINDFTILKNVSLDIPENKITAIIGPSGSGKSSLLKSMTKLYPSIGSINFQGDNIDKYDVFELRRNLVYVQQEPVVFNGTVRDNITWGSRIWKDLEINPIDLIKKVDLPEKLLDKKAKDLSLGQKQRVHLARSLALEPKVLLLDEPASALDAITKENFELLMGNLIEENTSELSIIMITHDLDQAKRIADYVVLIVAGEVRLSSNVKEFFSKLSNLPQAETLRKLMEDSK